ncbi:MAG: NCS2 family permease [Rhodopirellula sp.]|nr:NCS2 family permease [Rhodopirellula sp.]
MNRLNQFFRIEERNSSIATEVRGGIATFLTMAYILAANPAILSDAGVPTQPAIICTALAAGICCIIMGLVANFPLALASGMGLNAFIAYTAAPAMGSWQAAMGLVVLDGLIILALVAVGLREAMLGAIPLDLRHAMAAGIGLFVALIGCVNAGIVTSSGMPVPPIKPGSFSDPTVLITLGGVVLTGVLLARRVPGAILIGIVACGFGLHFFAENATPPAEVAKSFTAFALPDFALVGSLVGKADVIAALQFKFLPLLLTLLMVDFFDTLGTVTAIGDQANVKDERNRIIGLRRILAVDSASAAIGGFFGVSSVTSYIESASGVSEGARTGLHSVVVGVLFLLCIFAAPLVAILPAAATAPALIIVGFLMAESITKIDFTKPDTGIPAFITLILIPMTYSISHGIGYGLLTYVAIQIVTLRVREVHPLLYGAASVFAVAFLWS